MSGSDNQTVESLPLEAKSINACDESILLSPVSPHSHLLDFVLELIQSTFPQNPQPIEIQVPTPTTNLSPQVI